MRSVIDDRINGDQDDRAMCKAEMMEAANEIRALRADPMRVNSLKHELERAYSRSQKTVSSYMALQNAGNKLAELVDLLTCADSGTVDPDRIKSTLTEYFKITGGAC